MTVKQIRGVTGLLLAAAVLFCGTHARACRFWVTVGEEVPAAMIREDLLEARHAVKKLGDDYSDGWSAGYYKNGDNEVFRSQEASHRDDQYDKAVEALAGTGAPIVFSHLRRASSGCVTGIENPHPFEKETLGKKWMFGHNGGISKSLLRELIGPEYLAVHPPEVCGELGEAGWIDSELLMIYFLKLIQLNEGSVEGGLVEGLLAIYKALPDESRFLNFFLSDGEKVWVFRRGFPLFYRYHEENGLTSVASTIPQKDEAGWREIPQDMIGVLEPGTEPRFIALSRYWDSRFKMNRFLE